MYINLNNKVDRVVLTLYKNYREKIAQIPIDYIESEVNNKLTMDEISNFKLKIPNMINKDNKTVENRLYNIIKAKQQIVSEITYSNGSVRKRRWTVGKPNIIQISKINSYKEITITEFQNTLKGKRVNFYQDNILQLYNVEKKENDEGILDNFESSTGWNINKFDSDCRYETIKTIDTVDVILQENYVKDKVIQDGLLFEYNVKTNVTNGQPIYFQFKYDDIVVTNGTGNQTEKINKINTFGEEPVDKNIIKIQVYHTNVVNYRYGIRYVLTLEDNSTVERYADFCYCLDNELSIGKITFSYETGIEVEKTKIKYINIDSDTDTSWFEYLQSIQDTFECVFLFDSYNMTMDIISRKNLGKQAPYEINFKTNLLEYQTNAENSNFPNALKVKSSQDGVDIIENNYFGSDIIYDFSYYVQSETMSNILINKWKIYEQYLIEANYEWNVLKDSKSVSQQKKLRIDTEISTLKSQISVLETLLNTYQKQGYSNEQARVKQEKDELENRLNNCLRLSSEFDKNIKEISNKITILNESIKWKNATVNGNKIFDEEDLKELNMLLFIEELNEDYFTDGYSLYNYSIDYLKNKLQPDVSINCTVVNLVKFMNQDWKRILILGDKFKFVGLDKELVKDLGTNNFIFSGYKFNVKDKKITNLEFVNKIQNSKDVKKNQLQTIRKKLMKIDHTITNYDKTVNNSNYSSNFISDIKSNGLNLKEVQLVSKNKNNINVIGENGFIIKDAEDKNKAIYLTSGCMYATEDNWESSKKYLDSNKIVGEAIKGELLLGSELCIAQVSKDKKSGQFYVGNLDENHKKDSEGKSFAIQVKDSKDVERVFIGLVYNEEKGTQEVLFALKDTNGNSTLSADENGELTISGDFIQNSKDGTRSVEIRNNRITFYNWKDDGGEVGCIGSTVGSKNNIPYIELYNNKNSAISIGYREDEDNIYSYAKFDKNLLANKYPIEFLKETSFNDKLHFLNDIFLHEFDLYLSDKYPDLVMSASVSGKMGVYGGRGFHSEKGISTDGNIECLNGKAYIKDLQVTGNKNCIQKTDCGYIPFYATEDTNSLLSITQIDDIFETKLNKYLSTDDKKIYSKIIKIEDLSVNGKKIVNQCINTSLPYNVYIFQLHTDNNFPIYNYETTNSYINIYSDKPMKFKIKLEGRRVGFEDKSLKDSLFQREKETNKRINKKIIDRQSDIASKEWKEYGNCIDC